MPSPCSYTDEPIYSELVFKSPFEVPLAEQGLPQGNTGNPSPDMDIQIYEWDGIKNRTYRPDLSSDSDYFSSSTYRVNDNFKGKPNPLRLALSREFGIHTFSPRNLLPN